MKKCKLLAVMIILTKVLEAQPYVILYTKQMNRNDELYALNVGLGETRITNHPAKDSSPALSPDGETIVFTSERKGWWKIWKMDLRSGEVSQLTNSSSAEYAPSWSPDGNQIIFTSGRSGNADLFVMNTDGSKLLNLTNSTDQEAWADWGADGNIYFSRAIYGNHKLVRIEEDGSNEKILTKGNANDLMPRLSPDRRKLLFYSDRDGNMEIYTLDLVTEKIVRLTHDPLQDIRGDWSADGKKIVFERGNKRDSQHIFIMNADGSEQMQLTSSGYNYSPRFAENPVYLKEIK